jgi:hypothetical protein
VKTTDVQEEEVREDCRNILSRHHFSHSSNHNSIVNAVSGRASRHSSHSISYSSHSASHNSYSTSHSSIRRDSYNRFATSQ